MLSHHKVVEHSHVNHLEQLLETSCDSLVGIRGIDHTRGMVMGQNDRCGVFVESRLDHLTGVNGASIDSAEEQLLVIE